MERRTRSQRVALIGAPRNSSGTTDGVARAPAALRQSGLMRELYARGREAEDRGDVRFAEPVPARDPDSGLIAVDSLVSMVGATREEVARALGEGAFPLVVGGDDPPLLGCLIAAREAYGRIGLLFVDGHEDAYPPHDSPTGEAADTELGLALGRRAAGLPPALGGALPLLRAEDIAMLGPRDAGILRKDGVASLRREVEFYDDRDLLAGDAGRIAEGALSRIEANTDAVWLHVDLDVLSTGALPAAADPEYLQPGGISWPDLEAITSEALSRRDVVGWTVVDYNPDLDADGRHAERVVRYVGGAIAGLRSAP